MESPLALVIDDDPSVRERARDALRRAGIEAVAVATAQEAIDALRAASRAEPGRIAGGSQASEELRRRLHDLAASVSPVLFAGEAGSGRRYLAACLHALSHEKGEFVVVPAGDREALDAALAQGGGTVFVAPLEQLSWQAQEALAASLSGGRITPFLWNATGSDSRTRRLSVMHDTPSAKSHVPRRKSSSSRDSTIWRYMPLRLTKSR